MTSRQEGRDDSQCVGHTQHLVTMALKSQWNKKSCLIKISIEHEDARRNPPQQFQQQWQRRSGWRWSWVGQQWIVTAPLVDGSVAAAPGFGSDQTRYPSKREQESQRRWVLYSYISEHMDGHPWGLNELSCINITVSSTTAWGAHWCCPNLRTFLI